MDANKLQKLKDINYQITQCCRNCDFSSIVVGKQLGTCDRYTYDHLKHKDMTRQLSIHEDGYCKEHIFRPEYLWTIGTWGQFTKAGLV